LSFFLSVEGGRVSAERCFGEKEELTLLFETEQDLYGADTTGYGSLGIDDDLSGVPEGEKRRKKA